MRVPEANLIGERIARGNLIRNCLNCTNLPGISPHDRRRERYKYAKQTMILLYLYGITVVFYLK